MSDLQRMLHLAGRARARGERCVLATLVSHAGEAEDVLGARAVVLGTEIAGPLARVGIANAIVERTSRFLLQDAPAKLVELPLDPDGATFAHVVLEIVEPGDSAEKPAREGPIDWLRAHLESDGESACAHLPIEDHRVRRLFKVGGQVRVQGDIDATERARLEKLCDDGIAHRRRTTIHGDVLVEVLAPALSLLVVGAGSDSHPLVDMAIALGWRVRVVDHRAEELSHPRLAPATRTHAPVAHIAELVKDAASHAVVVCGRERTIDREALRGLFAEGARERRYIGVVGAKSRTQTLLAELDVPSSALAKMHAPAGLDLGGLGADALALSIVAEIQAVSNDRTARSRDTARGLSR